MTIVNINDIEDLIIAKYEIDTILNEQGKLEGRSNLQEFINEFATPQYIYLINNLQIPFNYFKFENKDYLFVTNSDESEINIIKSKEISNRHFLRSLSRIKFLQGTDHVNNIISTCSFTGGMHCPLRKTDVKASDGNMGVA